MRNRILSIVIRRLPQSVLIRHRRHTANIALSLAFIYEEFLYKYAIDMESYSDIDTLAMRVTAAARANNWAITSILSRGNP